MDEKREVTWGEKEGVNVKWSVELRGGGGFCSRRNRNAEARALALDSCTRIALCTVTCLLAAFCASA